MGVYREPLSHGGEMLVRRVDDHLRVSQPLAFDAVIVGSGYGGAVAAARLSEGISKKIPGEQREQPLDICVLERGLEHLPGSFPRRLADLPGHVRVNRFDTPELTGDGAGLFDLRIGADVSMLLGNGLGGGSLINAGVAEIPEADVFRDWPAALRNRAELDPYFERAARMLGAVPAVTKGLRKYREFAAWAEGLGLQPRPANVAVTFRDRPDNDHGVEQKACIKCGDCFTGCNHYAKNTLPMNYLARAQRDDAELYTGITVSHLEQAGQDWKVFFRLTSRPGQRQRDRKLRWIVARQVVLAAGALGSTEILMRSKRKGLRLSEALGTRFSCNGDMISGLYAQDCTVNAAPHEDVPCEDRNVGPTITGIARKRGSRGERMVLEELAIPAALRHIFEEVLTSAAIPYRVGAFESSIAFPRRVDPAAVDPDAIDRSQVFAAMGEDTSRGKLDFIADGDDADPKVADGVVTVRWPEAAQDPIYKHQDDFMSRPSVNGGEFIRSPLWQPLPPEMAQELGGEKPKGKVFTVHPLGGCPMGDDIATAVVNDGGQVLQPGSPAPYANLLVLDGSIVPSAIGINPLLTITALAERGIELCIERELKRGAWLRKPVERPLMARQPDAVPSGVLPRTLRRGGRAFGLHALADRLGTRAARRPDATPARTALRFSERVRGKLRLGRTYRMALTLRFASEDNVPAFLRNGSRKLRIESGELEVRAARGEPASAAVTGDVMLLQQWRLTAFERTFVALRAFLRRRGIADWLQKRREERVARGGPEHDPSDERWGRRLQTWTPVLALLGGAVAQLLCLLWPIWLLIRRLTGGRSDVVTKWIRTSKYLKPLVFVGLAFQIGEARRLRYSMRLEDDLVLGSLRLRRGTVIKGQKMVRYTLDGNPWWQVFRLPVRIRQPWTLRSVPAALDVDLDYFFRRYAAQLQITAQRNLPDALLDLASTVLFLLRIVGKVHFWSFRLPEYQKHDPRIVERRTPGDLAGLNRERHWIDREERAATPKPAKLLLTHYWKQGASGVPVVLFHGLGASGNQFATDKLDRNLVQHLADAGRDIWVAELRHSIALESSLQQWSLDTVALNDVPRLVHTVLEKTAAPKVDVVAHCIGSAMFCTAVLAGKLQRGAESVVNAAALLQVGPLITLSPGTRIRAYLAAFLRRYMREAFVDFSVDDQADWMDSLVDRVLATYPYPAREERHHRLQPPWEPHRHLANCNRWAAIDGRMIEHANLDERMLESLGEILGHANLETWEQTIQYAYMERLTDAESRNYVTEKNVKDYFGFPVRFIHGRRNDVFSTDTARRSWRLLKQVHGERYPSDVQIIPGYSHLDPLIGKNAHRDVYPKISEFLAGQAKIKPLDLQKQPQHGDLRRPLIGPIIGWTRRNASGGWTVRVWCRVDDTRSPCSYVIAIPRRRERGRAPVPLYREVKIVQPHPGRIDTLAVFDIDLDGGDAEYEIFVVSVHLSWRPQPKLEAKDAKWQSFAPPELTLQLPREEVDGRIAEAERLWGSGRDHCTTDPHYDQPIYKVVLDRHVLEQHAQPDALRLALGSCRYGASVIDRERADAVFGRLRRLIQDPAEAAKPGLLLLVGDQIYADQTAGVFDPRGRRERYYEAYREAWTAPNARAVLSRLPTYMMMDDHEVGDNWHPADIPHLPQDRLLRTQGLEAFQEYQLLHSPRYPQLSGVNILPAHADGFWYDFRTDGFPFFVLDTRSSRDFDGRIVSAGQMLELKKWLARQPKDLPKFIVSPSVVVPYRSDSGPEPAYASRSDAWDGYSASLEELFRTIWQLRADNVVFLSGDAHLSMASRIWFENGRAQPLDGPRAYCIVSSGMYAPFPFANSKRREYLRANGGSRRLPVDGDVFMRYEVDDDAWLEEDNFTIVEVAKEAGRWKILLSHHMAQGAPRGVDLSLPPAARPARAEVVDLAENRIGG